MIIQKLFDIIANSKWNKRADEDSYPYSKGGYFKNVGTRLDEEYVWIDTSPEKLRKYWLNVYRINETHHLISVEITPDEAATEHLDCDSDQEVQRGIRWLKAYYEAFGTVTVKSFYDSNK